MNVKNIRYNKRWKTEAIENRILLHNWSVKIVSYFLQNYLLQNLSVISLELIRISNFSALDKFEYWDKFIHMVKGVYTNIQSKIKINGLLSDPFTLMRNVCQGCLFSTLLYIIAAEVLASFINANKRIKRIQIGDHEIKIINFADDTTIFLKDINYLDRIQVILKLDEDASSSKINFSKSRASAKFSLNTWS